MIGLAVFARGFRRPLFYENLGIVEQGRVYRSAQPFKSLQARVREYHLRSVLNLRGGSNADPFYANEVRVTRDEGIAFYDFPMSAVRRPTRRELLVLLDLFEHCEYPLLIHCKSGADRTGLATVLYRMARRGEPYERARDGFSLKYGHVGCLGTERLHEPFEEYAGWLASQHLVHSPERFRDWIAREYRTNESPGLVTPLRPGPRVPRPRRAERDRVAQDEPRTSGVWSERSQTSR